MRTSLPVVVACLLVVGSVGTAAAQSDDDSIFDDFLGDDEDDGGRLSQAADAVRSILGLADGFGNRIQRAATASLGFGDDPSAQAAADDLQSVANKHAGELQDYANARVTADTAHDVFKVDLTVDGQTATRYITADVVNGSYQNASMVSNSTRTVDESCELRGAAATQADDELEGFVDEFVEPGEDVSPGFVGRLKSQYVGLVDCSFL